MKQNFFYKLFLLTILTLLPTAIQAQETYDLTICGTQVTSANASDILGDGVFSYDAETKTLTVSGDCTYTDQIVSSKIEGLVINVASNSELNVTTNQKDAIVVDSNATITGNGKLTLNSETGGGISFYKPITIEDINIEINGGPTQCIWGQGVLTIRNSTIHATSSEGRSAISCTRLYLTNYVLTLPENGYVDLGRIRNSEGQEASEVLIEPGDGYYESYSLIIYN